MILLDANIFMYAAGIDHPHKAPCLALLLRVGRGEVDAAADVEVLQEILHRYSAAGRAADGARLYSLARRIVSTWLPVDVGVLDRARNLMTADAALGARDALHAAVYFTVGAAALCSYDRDFDRVDGLARVEPDGLA